MERVFIKAKGALYLDEQAAKRRERLYSFLVGVLVVVIGVFANLPTVRPEMAAGG